MVGNKKKPQNLYTTFLYYYRTRTHAAMCEVKEVCAFTEGKM